MFYNDESPLQKIAVNKFYVKIELIKACNGNKTLKKIISVHV